MTDRELDALVAEKVFGLVRCQAESHKPGGTAVGWVCYADATSPDAGAECLLYSTDIAAAWRVVEKVIHEVPGKEPIMLWRDFKNGEPYGPSGYAARLGATRGIGWDTNPARALCLAALAALGVEVGEKK